MVNGLLLLAVVIFVSAQQVTKKGFSGRVTGGALTFSAASCVAALVVFLITSGGKLVFATEYLGYSALFAVSYGAAVVFGVLAVQTGPLSLTSLLTSFSLLIPTFYGIFVLDEPVSLTLYVGLALLLVALVLINLEKKGEKKQITLRWVVYVLLGFVGNGACSTVQKVQQMAFPGAYKSEFMIAALLMTILGIGICALLMERGQIKESLKKGAVFFIPCGLSNGIVNFLVIVLSARMDASVMFPVISGGGIVLAFLISILFYKEKLSLWQILGSALGLISVVLLNL
jgi:drug/metabolite transporter (DMT)-like permease